MLKRIHWLPIAFSIDFKIATLTYKAVHLKQPLSLAQHLKLKSIHFITRNNDQLLLGHIQLILTAILPTVWNKVPDYIRNAPLVTSFRKQLKAHYFRHLLRPPEGCRMSYRDVCNVLALPDMWILTLINVSGLVSHFWVLILSAFISSIPLQKRLTNPETLIKVKIPISGSVKIIINMTDAFE